LPQLRTQSPLLSVRGMQLWLAGQSAVVAQSWLQWRCGSLVVPDQPMTLQKKPAAQVSMPGSPLASRSQGISKPALPIVATQAAMSDIGSLGSVMYVHFWPLGQSC